MITPVSYCYKHDKFYDDSPNCGEYLGCPLCKNELPFKRLMYSIRDFKRVKVSYKGLYDESN